MLKRMPFTVVMKMDVDRAWILPVGTKIEIKNFDGKEIKFRIAKNDVDSIKVCAEECLKRNLKYERKNLKDLLEGIDLWNKEPDKFESIDKVGRSWRHKEGKKCSYSYLANLGYFFSKQGFEDNIKKTENEIEKMITGQKDNYYYDIVATCDYEFSVEEFNKHINNI